ncbi:MAG TPA: hypothetical protein VFA74_09155 [Terriglobales bacterium]|nr:hypothetical protein [Terriglobales bacterium]
MKYFVLLLLTVSAQAQELTPAEHFKLAKQNVARCLTVADNVASAKTLDEANEIIAVGAPVCHAAHRHFVEIPKSSAVYPEAERFRQKANIDLRAAEGRWKAAVKTWVWNLENKGWACRPDGDAWMCKPPVANPRVPKQDS